MPKINVLKYLEIENFISNNITKVGTDVTIDRNGISSGYTTSSYLKYNTGVAFDPSDGSNFEVNLAFKLPTGATGGHIIGYTSNNYHVDGKYGNFWYYGGIQPVVTRNGIEVKLYNELKNQVLSYSRCNVFYTATFSRNLDTTSTYVINIKKVGTTYTTTFTDLGGTFTDVYTNKSNEVVNQYNDLIGADLGAYDNTTTYTSTAFNGKIDLFNSWITKNGNYWWINKEII